HSERVGDGPVFSDVLVEQLRFVPSDFGINVQEVRSPNDPSSLFIRRCPLSVVLWFRAQNMRRERSDSMCS
ncbi:MAG: hypothetical protein ACI9KE_006586, partial [Polyangiales bacterium]